MNNSKVKDYVIRTAICLILGAGILFLLGLPLYNYADGIINMVVVKGAPSYPNEYDGNVFEKMGLTLSLGEVQVPRENTLYAYIRSEDIELMAPIYYGDSEDNLLLGVGHYIPSGLFGEGKPILLAGHDTTFFAPLEHVKVGDKIAVDTVYGSFDYIVQDTLIADAKDESAYDLDEDEETLILYTCYPFGELSTSDSSRLFVYCQKLEQLGSKEVAR